MIFIYYYLSSARVRPQLHEFTPSVSIVAGDTTGNGSGTYLNSYTSVATGSNLSENFWCKWSPFQANQVTSLKF